MVRIPDSVLIELFAELTTSVLYHLCQTNRHFRQVCQNDLLWKKKFINTFGQVDLSWLDNKTQTYKDFYEKILNDVLSVIQIINDVEKVEKVLLSNDSLNGLMAFLYLYFESLKEENPEFEEEKIIQIGVIKSPETKDEERKAHQKTKEYNLKRYNDYIASTSKNQFSGRLEEPQIIKRLFGIYDDNDDQEDVSDLGTVGEYYADASPHFELASYESDDFSLQQYIADDSIIDYVSQFLNQKNTMRYIAILMMPDKEQWIIVTFDNLDFLRGVKLACKIFKLDCNEYIVNIFDEGELISSSEIMKNL